jgi:beta-carotene 3-hydroxylase
MNFAYVLIGLLTMVAMECAVTLFHRYVMHGFGWGWHQSHHLPARRPVWEKNDLYAVVFAAATILLFAVSGDQAWIKAIAVGITLYGVLYALLHDGIIHRRLPLHWVPKHAYLQRLIQAHHLHHAIKTREHGVAFGFLYSPPVDGLREHVRRQNSQHQVSPQDTAHHESD